MIAIITSDVATGRTMNGADGFMTELSSVGPATSASLLTTTATTAAAARELIPVRPEPRAPLVRRHLLQHLLLRGRQGAHPALLALLTPVDGDSGARRRGAWRRDRARRRRRNRNLRPVLQAVGTVDDDGIPGFEPVRHHRVRAVGDTELDRAHPDRLIGVDDED